MAAFGLDEGSPLGVMPCLDAHNIVVAGAGAGAAPYIDSYPENLDSMVDEMILE